MRRMSPDTEAVRLVYVQDNQPGWRRQRRGPSFRYVDEHGHAIRDAAQLQRIRSLAIPPAYEDVWICPLPNGHLQATGRDARGRKQYRYHAQWQAQQGQTKFERLREFGAALPRVRRRVQRDLAAKGLPREKLLAALVRLLDTTYMRVGNDEYARSNGSFGLTTLRRRHASLHGGVLLLAFAGKSGVKHQVVVEDARLARIVKRCQDLPGQSLFQYLGEDGEPHGIGSSDVNDYLREASGGDFTAKDFRTWHASAMALDELLALDAPANKTDAKTQVKRVICEVASQLGHTPTVCRKSYVHSAVIDGYTAGSLLRREQGDAAALRGLKHRERDLMALLAKAARQARGTKRKPRLPAAPAG